MRHVALPNGTRLPILGQGTWMMGEDARTAPEETKALLTGLDVGLTLIDTAEMYGDGATETFLGAALAGRRDDVVLVSKVLPQNASRQRLPAACEGSLRRLKSDRIDLYLLHWRGSVPLDETVEAMEALVAAGKIGAWGVSNFDVADMTALLAAGGDACATNQVLYNVTRRGPEFDLLPWLADRTIPPMAYSPVEQGRLPRSSALAAVAETHGVSRYQVALAWAIRDGAIAIPKAAAPEHVLENRAAADLQLSTEDLGVLDAAFARPTRKRPLEML